MSGAVLSATFGASRGTGSATNIGAETGGSGKGGSVGRWGSVGSTTITCSGLWEGASESFASVVFTGGAGSTSRALELSGVDGVPVLSDPADLLAASRSWCRCRRSRRAALTAFF